MVVKECNRLRPPQQSSNYPRADWRPPAAWGRDGRFTSPPPRFQEGSRIYAAPPFADVHPRAKLVQNMVDADVRAHHERQVRIDQLFRENVTEVFQADFLQPRMQRLVAAKVHD